MKARLRCLTLAMFMVVCLIIPFTPAAGQDLRSTGNEIEMPSDKSYVKSQPAELRPQVPGIEIPSATKSEPVLAVPQEPLFKGMNKTIGEDYLSPMLKDLIYDWNAGKSAGNSGETSSPLEPRAPVYLKARIEHKEHLDALPEGYRAGNPVNVKDLQSLSGNNFWRKIDKEMGGTWVSEDWAHFRTRELKSVERAGKQVLIAGREHNQFKTERAYKRIVIGFQLDSEGNAWTYEGGLTEVIEGLGSSTYDTNFRRDVIEETPDKIITRNTSTRISVMGPMISESVQLEQFDTAYIVRPGVKRVEASLKLFDENGDALVEVEGARLWHKVAPFMVVNNYQGHDMRALFREFLTTHNMTALLPRGD